MFTKTKDAGDSDGPETASHAGDRPDMPRRAARPGQKSILASDLLIKGIVATEGALEVQGTIDGEIAAESIVIGHEGRVTGTIRAAQAELRGHMAGDIACGELTIRAAAKSRADAVCETLVIESGAWVEGRFSRPAPAPARPEPAKSAAAGTEAPKPDTEPDPAGPDTAKADTGKADPGQSTPGKAQPGGME